MQNCQVTERGLQTQRVAASSFKGHVVNLGSNLPNKSLALIQRCIQFRDNGLGLISDYYQSVEHLNNSSLQSYAYHPPGQ
jgi:hypothetical protein